ncbi:TPR repeat-containing protein [Calothrix parasitica NIES-267]|uniref:TPR repeat-containing protein n=1 Tax=Calothrix parasitica NIES-267 TaxID=1973488 RepID=A0A1Z4LTT3_9CYAN|nr:TPR repeat-containing protein [Calothrix parasitica NIES-267]
MTDEQRTQAYYGLIQVIAGILVNLCNHIQGFPLGRRSNNLEIAIKGYKTILTLLSCEAFPQDWAMTQNNLAIAYDKRIKGDRGENIELAIAAYNKALQVYTREDFPQDWATTQNNLAIAYNNRIKGDRRENIELAIAAYNKALQVRTREAFPQYWAMTQNNLAAAYNNRIKGNRGENIELAIAAYNKALQVYTREAFPQYWAGTQNNLAAAYNNRIKGDRRENIELAIAACNKALQVRTREALPQDWAMTQNNLANAYSDRIKGDRRENIELAIAACNKALQVRTREALPQDWAKTQNNLANAYSDRIKGDRGENIELAIAACNKALQVYTREAFPQYWAGTQNNLANAYSDRIKGDRGENIELAIAACNKALQVYTREALPQNWAMTQNNLANAYSQRIKGDRGENIELAIPAYNKALQFCTREALPIDWAGIQNNLAIAYNNRIKGNRRENIELAIAACNKALQVYTRQAFPQDWATTQNNLANAYNNQLKGDKGENIELAIAAYNKALQVYTRQALPQNWAMTQNNLAIAYDKRIKGNRGENIELAIAAYNKALQVYTREAFPLDWTATQNNLAGAYFDRIKGNREENLELAIAACNQVLQVYTPETFPIGCLQTGKNLGNLGYREGNWQLAIEAYTLAIEAVETSRSWSTNDERRQEIISEAIGVYEKIIQSYVNLKQYDKAIEYAERSRSKRLVDLMASNDLYSQGEIPQEVKPYLDEFYRLQTEIEQQRQHFKSDNEGSQLISNHLGRNQLSVLKESRFNIQQLQEKQKQVWQNIRSCNEVLAKQIKVEHLEFNQLQSLIKSPHTAILSFYTTSQHTHVFILTQTDIQIHTCEQQNHQELQNNIFKNWLQPYIKSSETWINNIPETLQEISDRLNINKLIDTHLQDIEELIIVPHLYLHLIPFAALPINCEQSSFFGEKFLIRIVPSCQILEFTHNRGELDQLNHGIVENASDDRHVTSFLGEELTKSFQISPENRLQGTQQATTINYRQLVRRVQVLHSIHHAKFDIENPLQSALELGDGEITLGELLTPGWRLPELSDVFLSCCETGLGLPEKLTDDILTLSAGFLCAGARNVISTLWSVDALATTLLCLFYYQYRQAGENRTRALQLAQTDLRSKTSQELKPQFRKIDKYLWRLQQKSSETSTIEQIDNILKNLRSIGQDHQQKPFESPYYWAGFVSQGLR